MRKSEHEKKKQREETRKRKGDLPFSFFLFPAPPTFCVPFTFASSPLSERLEHASVLVFQEKWLSNARDKTLDVHLEVSVKKHITSGTPIRFQFRRPSPYKPWPVCLPELLLLACTLLPGLLLRQIPEKKHKQIFYTKTTSFKKFPNFIFDNFGKSGTQKVPWEWTPQ